jgi:hypothetical protein
VPNSSLYAATKTAHEERNLRALAHHRHRADNAKRQNRFGARPHLFADSLDVGGELAAVARHPNVVPNEHDDGDEQDRSVEDLLPDARTTTSTFSATSYPQYAL